MKNLILFCVLIAAFYSTSTAQSVPQGMNYQAVARDLSGKILSNQPLELVITLHSDIERQTVEYSESHHVKTNEVGLFTLVVGQGNIEKGTFEKVPWSTHDIWMEVSIKDLSSTDFVTISNSKLLTVPYAFHAGTAAELLSTTNRAGGNGPGVPANVWSLFGNSNTNETTDKLGTTDCQDLIIVTNNIERLRITCEGVVNIVNDLNVGANLDVGGDAHIGNDLTVDQDVFLNVDGGNTTVNGDLTVANMSSTHLTGTLEVDKATDLNLTLNVDGATDLNSSLDVNNMSPTHLTGTLEVDKATDLSSTLNVDGATDLNGSLDVNNMSPTHLTGTLTVDKATDLNMTLNVDGSTDLNSSLDVNNMSPTYLTGTLEVDKVSTFNDMVNITDDTQSGGTGSGALKVAGGAGIAKNVHIGGTLTAAGVTTINNTLNVNGGSSYVANFVNSTNANGISIQVNAATPANANDFITFKNSGGGTVGRIEGQTADELHNSFGYIWYQTMNALNDAFAVALIVVDLIGVDDADAAVVEGVELALAIAEWLKVTIELDLNLGVVYESGSGDYAEWLQKDSPEEVFSFGDVVGVKGGRISKAMTDADQYMVVSLSPIILGNMPPADQKEQYEKIAFMGQVPVKVRGVVNIGDYIISSPLDDGFGVAVSPEDITLDQYKRIVGVAWTESDGKKAFSMVNVAVGINTNDTVDKLKKQQESLDAVMQSMNNVISYLQSKDPSFDADMFEISTREVVENEIRVPDARAMVAASSTSEKMALVSKFLDENPEVLRRVMNDTKAMLDERGIDYNRFEQTRRLLNDEKYLITVMSESNR
jgi:hypothetical protein